MVAWNTNSEEGTCHEQAPSTDTDIWGALPLDEPRPESSAPLPRSGLEFCPACHGKGFVRTGPGGEAEDCPVCR